MKSLIASLLIWSFVGIAVEAQTPGEDAYRKWTDVQGRTLEAKFIGLTNDSVTLETRSGQVHTVPLLRLSAADLAMAKSMGTTGATDSSQWSPPARPGPIAEVKSRAKAEARDLIKKLNNPKPLTVDAVEVFAEARALYREGLFEECQKELLAFWKKNPRESGAWALQSENVGFKLGAPCVYPALILLTDAVAGRIKEKSLTTPVQMIDWNVVALLVGKSSGFMPANEAEAKEGKGTPVSAAIDPLLLADNHRAVHDLVWLTREYYRAVTEGKINMRLSVVHLADLEFKVCAPGGPGGRTENMAKLKAAIPPEVAKTVDWYWLIYPEIEPPRGGKFYLHSYDAGGTIPGGITSMPGTNNTLFMCEDHWLTRRTIEDGRGPVHPLSHNIYFPYWMQHEFFHDHFGRNTHLQLEVKSHQWFDRATWPSDFVGRFEPDYYSEAMFKRLQSQAKPSLAGYFIRRSWFPDMLSATKPEDLVGRYSVAQPENGWGAGEVKLVDGKLEWKNDAGKTWGLTPEKDGILKTDSRNPYFDQRPNFEMVPARGADGLPSPGLGGLKFGDQVFLRQQ